MTSVPGAQIWVRVISLVPAPSGWADTAILRTGSHPPVFAGLVTGKVCIGVLRHTRTAWAVSPKDIAT